MSVSDHIDRSFPGLVAQLRILIRQPSVSAKNEGITQCAILVKKTLEKSGIGAEILRLKKGVAPLVYGEVRSRTNPAKTLLFYNHYDVQPAEPLESWRDPPFGGVVRGNKIFGRGSSDDKGELIARIKAVEAFLRTRGDVPCNIKFVIEGEEETGSAHIEQYLKKYRKKFSCDGVIWEFGYVDSKDRPVISLGMKGLLYVELSAVGPKRDAHSSLAVLIENPAWRLIAALGTLRRPDGRILVRDWYKGAIPLSRTDRDLLQKEPFDESAFKKEFGLKRIIRDGFDAKKALAAESTCNIAGFSSGYAGSGAKTVLPGTATAKVDFRLTPGMDPKKQAARLRRHLVLHGFTDITVRVYHGEPAARTDPREPLVSHVRAAAMQIYGASVLNISSAATGPMHQFQSILKSPCVAVGCTHVFARIHSPNEFVRLDLLKKTAKCMSCIIEKFGAQ